MSGDESNDCSEPKRAWIQACVPLWAVFVITFAVVLLSIAGTTFVLFLINKLTSPNKTSIKSVKQTFTISSRRQTQSKNLPPGNSVLLMPESSTIKPPARCPRRKGAPLTEPRSNESLGVDSRPTTPPTAPRGNGDDTSTDLPPNESKEPVVHMYHDPDDVPKKETPENSVDNKPQSANQPTDDKKDTLDYLKSDLLKSKQHLTGTKLISANKDVDGSKKSKM